MKHRHSVHPVRIEVEEEEDEEEKVVEEEEKEDDEDKDWLKKADEDGERLCRSEPRVEEEQEEQQELSTS